MLQSAQRVLVAHERPDVAAEAAYHLARVGYRVATALTSEETQTALRLQRPDLLAIGARLPGCSGLESVRRLRATADGRDMGVLVLLTDDEREARFAAFDVGADDCVTWPWDARELLLRAGAVLRRSARVHALGDGAIEVGPLTIDHGSAEVTLDGRTVRFTRFELELLWVLARHPGRVFTRDQLVTLVWPRAHEPTNRRVDMHLMRIRAKLGPHARMLETVPRTGYRLVARRS